MGGDGNEHSNRSSERNENEKGPEETLRGDLTRILRYGFHFKGKFAFSMPMPNHPNPCLHVDGVGIVGLPLSDHGAHLITAAAGPPTSRDTVRDAILVDCSKVSFKSPRWGQYLDEVIRERVKETLGYAPCGTPPRCEFRKLFLQKPGTRFFSPVDAETPPGTFATLTIVLPSEFTGGQIRASHGDESVTLESATDSLYETTLLAWYSDVNYEAEELTSGYRLALVYNLVHTSLDTPLPRLPSENTLADRIRELFHKWVSFGYGGLPDDHVAVYVLGEEDRMDDRNMLSVLKDAADVGGMMLLLGFLCAHITGWAEASTNEKPPYGLSQGTLENPVMERVYLAKFKVKGLTDVLEKPTRDKFRLIVNEGNLVPKYPFSGIEPDEQRSLPFTGNGDTPLEYWYERHPALVLFPSSKQLDVLLASGGVQYALAELKKSASEGPTKENQKIVDYIFLNWGKTSPPEYYIFDIRPSYEVPTMSPLLIGVNLADIAVQSNDVKLWVRTVDACRFEDSIDLRRFGLHRIIVAVGKFQFEDLAEVLGPILDFAGSIAATVAILQALGGLGDVSHPETQKDLWLSEHLDRAFTRTPQESDLPSIVEVAFAKGLQYIARVVMPSLLPQLQCCPFATVFVEMLEESKDRLLALPDSQGQTLSNQELFDNILEEARHAISVGSRYPLTDSDDDDSESVLSSSADDL